MLLPRERHQMQTYARIGSLPLVTRGDIHRLRDLPEGGSGGQVRGGA